MAFETIRSNEFEPRAQSYLGNRPKEKKHANVPLLRCEQATDLAHDLFHVCTINLLAHKGDTGRVPGTCYISFF